MQYLWQIHKLDFNRMRKSSRFNSRLQDFREVEQIWGLVNSPFQGPGNSHSTKEVEIRWHLSLVCAMKTMTLPTKAITTSFKISSHLCVWYCLLLNSLSSDYKLLNSPRDAEAAPLSPHRTEAAQEAGLFLGCVWVQNWVDRKHNPKLSHALNYMKHRFVCRCFYCSKTLYYNAEMYKQVF